jgi:hypothetical protein
LTKLSQSWGGDSLTFTISPTDGDLNFVPEERIYLLNFRGIASPDEISIYLNGSLVEVESSYQTGIDTLEFTEITMAPSDKLSVILHGNLMENHDRETEILENYLFQFKLESWEKKRLLQDWPRIAAGKLSLSRYHHLSESQRSVLESLLAR